MQNKKRKLLWLVLGLCILITGACGLSAEGGAGDGLLETGEKDPDDMSPLEKLEELLSPDKEKDNDTKEKDKEKDKKEHHKKSEDKNGGQSKPFWQSETSKNIQNLTAVAQAAEKDYKVNGPKRGWMSKNGKLYGYYDGAYVTPSTLVRDGYLESGLDTEGFEILLIDGCDLAEYSGADVPAGSMRFMPFAAVRQSGKILLASEDGRAGSISEESYDSLLAKYNQNHGAVGRLSSASPEYDRIQNYISLYEGKFESYFIREIRKDSRHAVVTFSSMNNTAAVKQYILRNQNNFWEVVYTNVEMDVYPITSINKLVPDFNVNLLPAYNLASWRNQIVQSQGGAVAALFSGHFISSESEIMYQCATSDCSYLRLRNGRRFAAFKEGGVWKAVEVSNDNEAAKLFKNRTGLDYTFIIWED